MATYTKNDLVDSVQRAMTGPDGHSPSREHITAAINLALASIRDAVADGKDIRIVGYLSSEVRHMKTRTVCNPRTGEPMTVPAHDRLYLRPGKELVSALPGTDD